ncbi:MAG: hypothetical protein P1V81_04660 [Planctomycetota bacterium]|nr:hypothetical protein [Planctomycetota bacterium]
MPFLAAISPGLLFFAVVVLIGFVVTSAKRHKEKLDKTWSGIGRRLELSYSTRKAMGSDQRKLLGEFRGYPVKVNTFTEGSGNSRKTYTRYRLRYTHLGLGLELSQQHFFSGLRSSLAGRQDIVVGSKDFDDAVIVQGGSSREVIDYLTKDRQLVIQRFLTSHRRATINDSEASFIVRNVAKTEAEIEQALEDLHMLAIGLERRRSEPRPQQPAAGEPVPMPDPSDNPLAGLNPEPRMAESEPLAGAAALGATLASPPTPIDVPLGQLAQARGSKVTVDRRREQPADTTPAPTPEPTPKPSPVPTPEPSPEPSPKPQPEPRTDDKPPTSYEPPPAYQPTAANKPASAYESPPAFESSKPISMEPRSMTPSSGELPSVQPPAPAPVPEPAAAPAPGSLESSDVPAQASVSFDYPAVRADLFETHRMSYETKALFENTYAGSQVRWTGKLKRLSSFSSDLVFQGPGVKAMIELEPFQDGSFAKDIEAFVQLPAGTEADLKGHVGQEVTLSGRLVSCNPFMRKLHIADGLLE